MNIRKVKRAVDRGNFESLTRAGAYVRGVAQRSIKQDAEYAPPGHPPHTRRGKLRESIFFAVEQRQVNAVIGPVATRLGQIGRIHEHGGRYRVRKKASKKGPAFGTYPKRPFMKPALDIARPRLPSLWAGSVHE